MKHLETNQIDEEIMHRFISFVNRMNEWEEESRLEFEKEESSNIDVTDSRNYLKEKLESIYSEFCTTKKRKHSRLQSLSFGTPPNYDISNLEIVSLDKINETKYIIHTKQLNRAKDHCRYVLVKHLGKWLIDKKELYLKFSNQWTNDNL